MGLYAAFFGSGIWWSSGFGGFGVLLKEQVGSSGAWMVLRLGVLAFPGLNLWYRFSTVFDYSRFVGGCSFS